jgi:hypothetical protein
LNDEDALAGDAFDGDDFAGDDFFLCGASFLDFLDSTTPPAALQASISLAYLSLSAAACFSNGAFSSAESPFHRSPSSLVTSVTDMSGLSSFILTLSFAIKKK